MPDDVAMNFRKSLSEPAEALAKPASGPSLLLLLVTGIAVGFAAFSLAGGYAPLTGAPALPLPWRAAPPAPVASGEPGPRLMSVLPGIREVSTATTALPMAGPGSLSQVYSPIGPVVLRKREGYVEIDSPRLRPPPIGPRRGGNAIYDHAALIANELRALAYTPCDLHLRHLAAANINLFVGGFMAPRTPINTAAPADTAFWRRPETSMVRRAVVPLVEKGALSADDFGLDASPQARGLFEGLPTRTIICG